MAWETRRNGQTYYYAKKRVDGKVVSQYIGKGLLAELHEEDVLMSQIEKTSLREGRREIEETEIMLDQLNNLIQQALEDRLFLYGFRNYKGQWRRRRA